MQIPHRALITGRLSSQEILFLLIDLNLPCSYFGSEVNASKREFRPMCGIVGLYLKTPGLKPRLGALFAPMLVEMSSRGPDSAGFAIYRDPVGPGKVKLTLASDDAAIDWSEVAESLEKTLESTVRIEPIASHAVLVTDADERAVMRFLERRTPRSGWSGRDSSSRSSRRRGCRPMWSAASAWPRRRGRMPSAIPAWRPRAR